MHDSINACIASRCDKSLRVRNCRLEGRAAAWKTDPIRIDQRRCTAKNLFEQIRAVKVERERFHAVAEWNFAPRVVGERPNAISTLQQQAGRVFAGIAEGTRDCDRFSHRFVVGHASLEPVYWSQKWVSGRGTARSRAVRAQQRCGL